ncbi:Myosin-2 [Camellia lanceoleosa]|uniref:Myosin-2 n=1 Tax=Camellia lanceoleosa TaxID=1840588 RepID=A0ACC0ILP0_9ERIC|nr:Myosin-2 [Camellia lanceoleosa]
MTSDPPRVGLLRHGPSYLGLCRVNRAACVARSKACTVSPAENLVPRSRQEGLWLVRRVESDSLFFILLILLLGSLCGTEANGSARVKLGATDVIASVKAELGKPSPFQPDKGKVSIYVDCNPTAAPVFEGRGGAGIDLSSLSIVEGKICWDLYIDGLAVSLDGNLLDALGAAIKGKLIEIHFSAMGKMCGAQIQTFLLEKSRVVQLAHGERSYHIFYQLCDGAPSGLKDRLNLKSAVEFHYLRQSGWLAIDDVDDARKFQMLMEALDTVQLCKEDQDNAFEMLAVVLWLGNISFQVIDNENHVEVVADEGGMLDQVDIPRPQVSTVENAEVNLDKSMGQQNFNREH